MFSGKNGSVIWTAKGDVNGDRFGCAAANIGDIDGDGIADLIVGAYQYSWFGAPGYVKFLSGKDGKVLRKVKGKANGDYFGIAVAAAGDLNGDKIPDAIVGAHQGGSGKGYVQALSGKDGAALFRFDGVSYGGHFGAAVCGGADLDNDGTPDLLVGAPVALVSIYAISGKTHKAIYSFKGPSNNAGKFGASLALVGDLNKDGRQDYAAGAPTDAGTGAVYILSGKDAGQLARFGGDSSGDEFGAAVAGVGDLNGDGHLDVLAGAPEDDNLAAGAGAARLLSTAKLSLYTDVHQLSLKKAGTQQLTIDVGATHAGKPYLVVGSWTGTSPGVTLSGVHIPLNPDLYTDFAIAQANSAVFKSFRGTLDGSGKAAPSFNVPNGLPTLVDVTLFHACLVYDASGILRATNAASLRLAN